MLFFAFHVWFWLGSVAWAACWLGGDLGWCWAGRVGLRWAGLSWLWARLGWSGSGWGWAGLVAVGAAWNWSLRTRSTKIEIQTIITYSVREGLGV